FSFPHTATPDISTLSLHDALPISPRAAGLRADAARRGAGARTGVGGRAGAAEVRGGALRAAGLQVPRRVVGGAPGARRGAARPLDRKSTRLNSSHLVISYAVFCLK